MIQRTFRRYFSTIQTQQVHSDPAKLKFSLVKSKEEKGQQNNLVVLHGFMGSQSNFRSIVRNQKVNQYTNSYLLDQRNHGLSQHKYTMSIPELAFDLKNFMKEQDIQENIVLMGHSMGGRVVMNFLQNYPELHDKIKGAVVVDILPDNYAMMRNPTVQETYVMVNKLNEMQFQNRAIKDIKLEIEQICGNKSLGDFISMQLGERYEPEFANDKYYWKSNMSIFADAYMDMISHTTESTNYQGPVKVICGERSTYINKEQAYKSFPRLFSNINVEEDIIFYKDAQHWLHAEKTGLFIEDLSNILQEWLD